MCESNYEKAEKESIGGKTYIIGDIHGCFTEYQDLLKEIAFSDEDELYILGDAMDRGPEPIKTIQNIMQHENMTYILGNHDYMMLGVLRQLMVEITEENFDRFTTEDMLLYYDWIQNGGGITLEQFRRLSAEEQADLLDYLEYSPHYEMIEHADQLYILVHANLNHFDPSRELESYDPTDLLWGRIDYTRKYFPGDRIFIVTGHTPTPLIRSDQQPLIYTENNHIALDCGCVFGGRLAAYCIETGEVIYMNRNA